MLFDTHVHLTDEDPDPVSYLERAGSAGVNELLFCSSGMENSRRSGAFAAASEQIYFAAGVHPHESQEMKEDVSAYREFTAMPRLIAIGELGLDYYYDISPRETQIRVFRDFLGLAKELDLPAIVHCRDKDDSDRAYADCFDILSGFAADGGRFELHSFAGTVQWMERFAALGAMFGVGGMLTFRRADNIREVVSAMPRERIMLETDSPYLAPVPHRGKVNHPAFLIHTADAMADLFGMTTEDVAKMTTENAHRFFRIGGGESA